MHHLTTRRYLLGLGAALCANGLHAQSWPSKPIRLVAPYAPGGGPDILARLFATEFDKILGPTIVDNRPGMGGSLGADHVAKSVPDGHTLLMTTTATQAINPALYSAIPYDPARDFTPIARVSTTPTVLVVANEVPARTLAELIEYARRQPGRLSYASAGPGTMQHITAELMRAQAGVELLHVPYKGTSQIVPDLVAGRVSMMFNSPAAVMQFVDQGKLRAIAITSADRVAQWPSLPTVAESGLPGFEATAWYALYGPAGLAPDIVDRLNAAVRRVLASPQIQSRLDVMGMLPAPSSPAELAALGQRDLQKWSALIKSRGISAQ